MTQETLTRREPLPEHALKRLEWLQAIITRMAANSFLIKGWATTISAALLALGTKDTDRGFALLAVYPALMFWCLDANYLRLEWKLRVRYEELAAPLGLSLLEEKEPRTGFARAFFAAATWPFYATVIAISTVVAASK